MGEGRRRGTRFERMASAIVRHQDQQRVALETAVASTPRTVRVIGTGIGMALAAAIAIKRAVRTSR